MAKPSDAVTWSRDGCGLRSSINIEFSCWVTSDPRSWLRDLITCTTCQHRRCSLQCSDWCCSWPSPCQCMYRLSMCNVEVLYGVHCKSTQNKSFQRCKYLSFACNILHYTTHTHTTILLLFWNMSGTTRVSRYQKGKTRKVKTNLDLL